MLSYSADASALTSIHIMTILFFQEHKHIQLLNNPAEIGINCNIIYLRAASGWKAMHAIGNSLDDHQSKTCIIFSNLFTITNRLRRNFGPVPTFRPGFALITNGEKVFEKMCMLYLNNHMIQLVLHYAQQYHLEKCFCCSFVEA